MTTPDTLRSLADRVESGEHTFALEREIMEAVEPEYGDPPRRYLSSIDATEALRLAKLPETCVDIGQNDRDQWSVDLRSAIGRYIPGATSTAPTEPAARLAAILRGVAASMEDPTPSAIETRGRGPLGLD